MDLNQAIQQIKETINIEEEIGSFVNLQRKGKLYLALCPFHNEKTPSFTVDPNKNGFKCYGCGEYGDVLNFLEKHEGLNSKEAAEYLISRYNLSISIDKSEQSEKQRSERENIQIVTNFAVKHFINNLKKNGQTGYTYLLQRGFTDETIRKFFIGFAKNEWDDLHNTAQKQGYDIETLKKAGYLSEKNGKTFDKFRNRVIFPFLSLTGKPNGISARTIDDDQDAKYMNTPNNGLFDKSRAVFGLYQAKKAIMKNERVFFMEGQTDVMSWSQSGIENVVAGSGTALTQAQIRMIKRFTNNIVLVMDGDNAGFNAAKKDIELLHKEGMEVYVFALPADYDPDSYMKEVGVQEVQSKIESEIKDAIDFLISQYKTNTGSDAIKESKAVNEMADAVKVIPDAALREGYARKIENFFQWEKDKIYNIIENDVPDFEKEIPKKGFMGLSEVGEAIQERKAVFLYPDKEQWMQEFTNGKPNSIIPGKKIRAKDVKTLRQFTTVAYWDTEIKKIFDANEKDTETITFLKTLVSYGFDVSIFRETTEVNENPYISFIDWYIMKLVAAIDHRGSTKTRAIEQSAEIISFLPQSDRMIKIETVKEIFKERNLKFSVTDYRKILNNYLKKNKTDDASSVTIEVDNPHNLGEGQMNDLRNYGIYFKDNKMFFETQSGIKDMSNFIMEPVLHTISTNNSRKLFKLENTNGEKATITVSTQEMNNLTNFLCAVEEKGNFVFEGTKFQLMRLKKYLYDKTIYSKELENIGWQPRPQFWAWANGIATTNNEFIPIDDYGLVSYDNQNYYLKPYSAEFADDPNVFVNERKFQYVTSDVTLSDWAMVFTKVFGEKSKLSIAAFMTSIFSDFIFARLGSLPIINLFGVKGTGKTEQAKSIISMFGHDLETYNLRKVTPHAASHSLKKFINGMVLFDEYKNNIGSMWLGFLISLYNRYGKIRGTIKEGAEVEKIPVNSMVFLAGQEIPNADPALFSRVIYLSYHNPKRDQDAKTNFNKLKEYDEKGKAHIISEILQYRDTIEENYMKNFYDIEKELTEKLPYAEDRIIKNYATVITTYSILQDKFNLHFDAENLKEIAVDCIKEQMNILNRSNELSVFWNAFMSSIEQDKIIPGWNYKIKSMDEITVTKDGKKEYYPFKDGPRKILLIRWEGLYNIIEKELKGVTDNQMGEESVSFYLEKSPYFLGKKSSERFKRNRRHTDIDSGEHVYKVTQAYAFDYNKIGIDLEQGDNSLTDDDNKQDEGNNTKKKENTEKQKPKEDTDDPNPELPF